MTLTSIGSTEPATSHSYANIDFYDLEKERKERERLMAMLNPEQSTIFDAIMNAIRVRGLGEIAVPIAWTGISPIILEGGRTAYSRFKLPVPILDNFSCSIRHNTEDGRFLKAKKLIIWDECTITPNHTLSTVDRLLRDLMNYDLSFGGKAFVLGGDWRQILPVAMHANRTTIIETCLKNSPLRNMRTEPDEQIGFYNGNLTNNCQLGEDVVEIPEKCVMRESMEFSDRLFLIFQFCQKKLFCVPRMKIP
ncbi:hypothetical protein AVEN_183554-1 [Araneus ventricosus]|uniref:ATP-dependent DNA helicase n=1 Tax=Araneus ventricosus TaxID=182803 RepID=A0A4Y2FI83_ARAVE|nr:hypothetical protein AVEN_183554-1 [Araneus ventricosus]